MEDFLVRNVSILMCLAVAFQLMGCADDLDPEGNDTSDAVVETDAMVTPDMQTVDCESLKFRFAAEGNLEMEAYPDDRYTVLDENSPTGLRLSFNVERFPWLDALPNLIKPAKVDFESLSGFAHNGSVLLRFDGPIPTQLPEADTSAHNTGLIWMDLDATPPTRIPFEVRLALDEVGIILDPLVTLTPGHRYAVLMTRDLWDSDICVENNPEFDALLNGELMPTSGDVRLSDALNEAMGLSDTTADKLVGGTAFTTHMDHLLLHAVAQEVRTRNYTWDPSVECEEEEETFRICNASFKAWDFRDPLMIQNTDTNGQWRLKVRIFLPKQAEAPLPVLIYGHGLNSDRFEGDRLAAEFSDDGFAVVAVDAMMHGEHPTRIEDSNLPALDFLGVDLAAARVEGAALHGNFTQTVVDRLQLLQLLRRSPDFDGDGTIDFDPTEIGYFGVSLGGMLGSLFLANANQIPAAILSISGGRLIQFLSDIPQIDTFRPALNNLAGGEVKAERVLILAQTMVDAADPATSAPFILRNRLNPGSQPPHLLVPVADKDETVPPATAQALARALGVPHVGPVFTEVFGLEQQDTPTTDNTVYGVTAGYFQFDRMSNDNLSRVEVAEHSELPARPEALLQARHFLAGWVDGELPEIIDPYEVMGTPPLPTE